MHEIVLHAAIAATLAFVLVLIAGALPIGPRPTRIDAATIAVIVFCVAGGHGAGIAAGRPLAGFLAGALGGIVLAGLIRTGLRRRA